MKVLISNMAWMNKSLLTDANLFLLKRKLTIVPRGVNYDGNSSPPIEMFREKGEMIGVPRFFYLSNNSGDNEETFDVSNGFEISKNVKPIALRKEDQEINVSSIIKKIKDKAWGGGIFEAYTAYGKSVAGIELILRLGGNALILVHKEPLMEQWIDNIRKFYPNCRVGKIQGDTCNYENKDIVVGMIQSMMGNRGDKYPSDMYRYFRTIVVDEVHRMGAEQFGTVTPRFNSKYILALSGTVRRSDGCENVFKWVTGEIIEKANEINRIKPIIYLRETGFKAVKKRYVDSSTGIEKLFDMNKFKKPTQLGFIGRSDFRNELIAKDVIKSLSSGRNPLVMSERLDILNKVAEMVFMLGQKALGRNVSNGFYIGKKKDHELEEASKCDVVYATSQLAKEGIDIPRLDTLFLVTPAADVEQHMGRVTRSLPNKKTPMIVDYIDSDLDNFKGLFYSRLRLYKRLGCQVIGMKL